MASSLLRVAPDVIQRVPSRQVIWQKYHVDGRASTSCTTTILPLVIIRLLLVAFCPAFFGYIFHTDISSLPSRGPRFSQHGYCHWHCCFRSLGDTVFPHCRCRMSPASFFRPHHIVLNAHHIIRVLGISTQSSATCTRVKLGYIFDSTVASALHASSIANTPLHLP